MTYQIVTQVFIYIIMPAILLGLEDTEINFKKFVSNSKDTTISSVYLKLSKARWSDSQTKFKSN